MRQTYKGAAAVAAICSAALAFGQAAVAANVPGQSGAVSADTARIAGIDRIQTALQAATATSTVDTFYIVGYGSQVDALTLATLNCNKKGYVLFVKDGLEKRHIEALTKHPSADILVIGGTKSVSANVEAQLAKLQAESKISPNHFMRVAGEDRFDTAYQVGALAIEQCASSPATAVADAHKEVDKLNKAIQDYMDAQKNYDEINKDYAAAKDALAKAAAAQGAAFEALTAEASKYVDTKDLVKEYKKATKKLAKADSKAKDKLDAINVVFDGIANTQYNLQGKSILEVTLQDFLDKYETLSKDEQKALKDVKETIEGLIADKTSGFTAAMKLQDAIDHAKAEADKLAQANEQYIKDLGKQQSALFAKIEAEENNAKIVKDLAKAYNAYAAAEKASKDALADEKKAKNELKEAIRKLSKAFKPYLKAMRDLPDREKDYRAALDKAYKGTNAPIFVSDGIGFADALAAGPAAKKMKGILLLTKGSTVPEITARGLDLSKSQSVAVGGVAAKAMAAAASQSAVQVYGADRYATAVEIAKRYFADGIVKGVADQIFALASGENGADAMAAGTYLTSIDNGAGVLLTRGSSLPKVTEDFLAYGRTNQDQTATYIGGLAVFGGYNTISKAVGLQAADALKVR